MKRRFKITVEGESYEVEVEEMEEGPAKPTVPRVKAQPAAAEAPPPSAPPPSAPPRMARPTAPAPPPHVAGVEVVTSPMPGTVVAVKAKVGDAVKPGDVLLILESMKIQNEIPAPKGGKVKEVHVSEGQYVKRRESLVSIEI